MTRNGNQVRVLSPLSLRPAGSGHADQRLCWSIAVVGLGGLEPPASSGNENRPYQRALPHREPSLAGHAVRFSSLVAASAMGVLPRRSRMLDSPEDVCAGQARFEYPATFVLFSISNPRLSAMRTAVFPGDPRTSRAKLSSVTALPRRRDSGPSKCQNSAAQAAAAPYRQPTAALPAHLLIDQRSHRQSPHQPSCPRTDRQALALSRARQAVEAVQA
jgi:hypothetical protein